jgi:hypothetical protein
MSDINNILLYATALYQVKEPKVNSIEAKTLMALMLTHLVRLVNLIESSTENLPPDGLSNFDHLNTLPGAICQSELYDHETDNDVPIPRPIKRQTRWQSEPHESKAQTTYQAQIKGINNYSGRLF